MCIVCVRILTLRCKCPKNIHTESKYLEQTEKPVNTDSVQSSKNNIVFYSVNNAAL